MQLNPPECLTVLNPDVAGRGIRASLYTLTILGPLVALLTPSTKVLDSIDNSLGLLGLSLFMTTLFLASQHSLDLFSALCIFHLIGLAGVAMKPPMLHERTSTLSRWLKFTLFYFLITSFFVFMIYIFLTAPNLGPTPDCNAQIVYVLYGIDIPATNRVFRWFFISFIILLLFTIPIGLTIILKMFKRGQECLHSYVRIMGDLAMRLYIIIILEILIRRNRAVTKDPAWSFGQMFCMTMLVGPIIEMVSLLFHKDLDDESTGILSLPSPDDEESVFTTAVIFYVMMSIIDLGFSAAAGAAAAATGAYVHSGSSTREVLELGALAGVIKSGMLNFSFLVGLLSSSPVSLIMAFVSSGLVTAFTVTAAITSKVLHTIPNQLLIASLIAGLPFTVAGYMFIFEVYIEAPFPFEPALYALAGYAFAGVAHSEGFDVCTYKSAAAAGAIFGTIDWIWKIPIQCGIQDYLQNRRHRHRR